MHPLSGVPFSIRFPKTSRQPLKFETRSGESQACQSLDQQPPSATSSALIAGEGRWPPFSSSSMEHQFRRGIYRPNAQRLSISLAPLVTQRSLMFRVKTDLATKASYAELTPMEESAALYSLPESAQIVSALLTVALSTAMSSASVYSQDSWKTESPAFVSVVKVDPRRMAIVFSPSVQWTDIAGGDNNTELTVKTPSAPSAFVLQPDVSFSEVKEEVDTRPHAKPDIVPPSASDGVHEPVRSFLDVGSPSLFEKRHTKIKSKSKKIDEQSSKRFKSSKAFRKVMARLSFQPSKWELARLLTADAVAISDNLPSMDFKLPEFRVSPINYSFIAQTHAYPSVPSPPSSTAPSDTLVEGNGEEAVRARQLRATMPLVTSLKRRGHRRYKSSPTVPYVRRWNKDNMPPLPPIPAGLLEPASFGTANI